LHKPRKKCDLYKLKLKWCIHEIMKNTHELYNNPDLGRVITPLLKYFINGNGGHIKVAKISRLSIESLEIYECAIL